MVCADVGRGALIACAFIGGGLSLAPSVYGSDEVTTTLSGGVRLQYLRQSTDDGGEIETRRLGRIDKVWLDAGVQWSERWGARFSGEAKNVGAGDRKDPELRELSLQFSPAWGRIYGGQFILPFGRFATSQISDPKTKELGEWFTKAGAGAAIPLGGEGSLEFAAFGRNDQTEDSDRDGAVLALAWASPARWHLGAAYLAMRQRETNDVGSAWTANGEVGVGAWKLRAETLTRGYAQANRRSAWYADLAYHWAEAWELGIRRQSAQGFAIVEDADEAYRDWGMTLRYRFSKKLSLAVEWLEGEQRNADGGKISREELRSRLVLRL